MDQLVKPKRKKRRWPRVVGAILTLLLLAAGTGLVLLDHFMPDQTVVPEAIVHIPEEAVSFLVRPLQATFSWASNHIDRYMQSLKLRKTLEIEYNKLKEQNDQLIYESLFNKNLEEENIRLRRLLGEAETKTSLNPILATVTAKESGNWFSIFTIDKGSAHGLEPDMAVINQDGLVGRVYEVQDYSAQVISIIDSRSSIGAWIESSRDQGIVKGTLGVDESATCRMYYLPVNQVPRPGDSVVTSGVGLPFPRGLRIGVVRESTRHMDENKHYIVIEPYVDFMHIEEVLVLVYKAKAEDMPVADDGQLKYVPAVLDTPRPVPIIGAESLENVSATVTPIPRPERGPSETPDPNRTIGPDDLDYLFPDDYIPSDPDATPTPDPDLAPEGDED